jgi:hypothetical protein
MKTDIEFLEDEIMKILRFRFRCLEYMSALNGEGLWGTGNGDEESARYKFLHTIPHNVYIELIKKPKYKKLLSKLNI